MCLLACGFLGCRPQPASESELGGLPRLRESQDPQLRDELARLVAEEATPALLEASERATTPTGNAAAKPDRSRNELLSPSELAALLANLDRIYPTGSFRLGPVEFEKASRLRRATRAALEHYRAIVAADDFRFHVALTSGLLADLSFLDQATAMHRLEAIAPRRRCSWTDLAKRSSTCATCFAWTRSLPI